MNIQIVTSASRLTMTSSAIAPIIFPSKMAEIECEAHLAELYQCLP